MELGTNFVSGSLFVYAFMAKTISFYNALPFFRNGSVFTLVKTNPDGS